jgi:uncharacterized membrane protein
MTNIFKKNILWIFFILILIIGYLSFLVYSFNYGKLSDFAQLGDSFGILNSLFSGFAFLALIFTIYQQNEDMRNTKKEMQNQNFENHFFHLLNIHNDLVSKFRQINFLDDGEKHYMYGGEAISFFLNKFKDGSTVFYKVDENLSKEEQINNATKTKNVDSNTLKMNISIKLGRSNLKFIDNIYLVLKLIDKQSDLTSDEKRFYIDTILAQITDEELVLIFYYTHAFNEKLKPFLEKFSFFENIDEQLLYNWQEEVKLYKREVYGKSSNLYIYANG